MVKQARAHATREAIVVGAGQVFGDLSYADATLSDVIKQAGVTQGALYFHFDSKLELAQEVIGQQHLISMAASEKFSAVERPSIEALILLSSELARQITTDPVVRGGLRLSTESAQLFPKHASGPYLDWIDSTKFFLRKAAAEGTVKKSLDFEAVARFVISTFTGVQVVSRSLTQWKDFNPRLEEMWLLLLPVLLTSQSPDETERLARLVRKA
jgi:TetR/AcrR family transcriptional repressor of uid operon